MHNQLYFALIWIYFGIILIHDIKTAQEKAETEEMVRTFREKKMRKAGTWTEADEEEKNKQAEEKDMFSDYD